MSEKYGNFQSQSAIKTASDEKQKAREYILEKAKKKYEVEEARREKARKAGEGTWMLDSLSKRLDNEQKSIEKAKKKKKKEKKKKKKKKRSKSSSSSSSSEEDGGSWVESGSVKATPARAQQGPQLQRESWMEAPLDLIPLTSKQEIREKIKLDKAEARRESDKMLEPGQHTRELNPYWKDGGTGLPEEKPVTKATPGAGDGGLSWLRTSLNRCKQQAKDEGRSLEEVASERWGSLQNLLDKLREAERQQARGHHSDRRGREMLGPSRKDDREHQRVGKRRDDRRGRGGQRRSSSSDESDRKRSGSKRYNNSSDEDSSDDDKQTDRRNNQNRDDRRRLDQRRDRSISRERRDRDEKSSRGSVRKSAFQRPDSDDDSDSKRYPMSKSRGFIKPSDHSHAFDRDSRRFARPSDDSESGDRHSQKFCRPDTDEISSERHSSDSVSRRFIRPGHDDSSEPSRRRSPDRGNREVPRWKKKVPQPEKPAEANREGKEKKFERKKKSRSPSSSDSSSSDSESDPSDRDDKAGVKEEQPVVVSILSEEQLNDLAAKILRAELMGDEDLATELKTKLETARKHREESKADTNAAPDFSARRNDGGHRKDGRKRKEGGQEEEEDDVVVLSRTTKGGMVRPVLGETADPWGRGAGGKRRKKNVATHDKTGARTTYFDNDDRFDLKSLVEQEKAGTAEDQNSMFARLAGRSVDKDLDVDDMFVSRAAKQQNEEKTFDKDRASAIFEHRKRTAAMEKCHRCLKQVPKHLIIALGTKSYVCLPPHRSLTEGHCLIVPMSHCVSVTALDEDVWQEMQRFRQSLVHMFAGQDQDVVVMETVMHLRHFPHTALECVPLEREVGDLAPIYFKKAIQEAGPEWSDNKKLHDLKGKDVRRVIPKGFPYFSVDFGLQSGFATVIEDESSFPAYFGREIVGGMIDAEPTLWRKPHKQSFEDQRQKVLQFEKWWRLYDWTQDLDATS